MIEMPDDRARMTLTMMMNDRGIEVPMDWFVLKFEIESSSARNCVVVKVLHEVRC